MNLLKPNLELILSNKGDSLGQFLANNNAQSVLDLKMGTLVDLCSTEGVQLDNLLNYNLSIDKEKLKKLKLLILDVDGVMTDGGMYYSQRGDEIKKYNTKDGMGIFKARNYGIEFGIISSGFKMEIVKARADVLKIEHFYVGRDPKIEILTKWKDRLGIDFSEMGIIGDDINDLEIMKTVGFSAAPADAVSVIKSQVDLVLNTKGGDGCIRELLDYYVLDKPLTD